MSHMQKVKSNNYKFIIKIERKKPFLICLIYVS